MLVSAAMCLATVMTPRTAAPNSAARYYVGECGIPVRGVMPVHAWKDALNRFAIIYENRLPAS